MAKQLSETIVEKLNDFTQSLEELKAVVEAISIEDSKASSLLQKAINKGEKIKKSIEKFQGKYNLSELTGERTDLGDMAEVANIALNNETLVAAIESADKTISAKQNEINQALDNANNADSDASNAQPEYRARLEEMLQETGDESSVPPVIVPQAEEAPIESSSDLQNEPDGDGEILHLADVDTEDSKPSEGVKGWLKTHKKVWVPVVAAVLLLTSGGWTYGAVSTQAEAESNNHPVGPNPPVVDKFEQGKADEVLANLGVVDGRLENTDFANAIKGDNTGRVGAFVCSKVDENGDIFTMYFEGVVNGNEPIRWEHSVNVKLETTSTDENGAEVVTTSYCAPEDLVELVIAQAQDLTTESTTKVYRTNSYAQYQAGRLETSTENGYNNTDDNTWVSADVTFNDENSGLSKITYSVIKLEDGKVEVISNDQTWNKGEEGYVVNADEAYGIVYNTLNPQSAEEAE